MNNTKKIKEEKVEILAKQLHDWYLEACLKPESGMDFNPAAQEPYENLKETQKFIDRYIAQKIIHLEEAVRVEVSAKPNKIIEKGAPSKKYIAKIWNEAHLLIWEFLSPDKSEENKYNCEQTEEFNKFMKIWDKEAVRVLGYESDKSEE